MIRSASASAGPMGGQGMGPEGRAVLGAVLGDGQHIRISIGCRLSLSGINHENAGTETPSVALADEGVHYFERRVAH